MKKMGKKLTTWKGRSINQVGRLVLLKASLDSIPIYWFNLFRLPKIVQADLDKLRKKFFWGISKKDGIEKKKMHLLKWSEVCKPKQQGGLGISSLSLRNSILLFKWW